MTHTPDLIDEDQTVDEILCQAFFIKNTLILGKSNSARIEEWIKSKGVAGGCHSGLSQHEQHAGSAMILKRAESVLNDIEWALVQAEYGYDLSGIVDLTKYVLLKAPSLQPLECDALLEYLFLKNRTYRQLQDKFDWSKGRLHRKLRQVKRPINYLFNECIKKLELILKDKV